MESNTNFYDIAQKLKVEGYDKIYILCELKRMGAEQHIIEDITNHIIQHKTGRKLQMGFLAILIGAVLLFSSFLLTITSSYTSDYTPFVLYGLTTIGICIVMYGFYLIFG